MGIQDYLTLKRHLIHAAQANVFEIVAIEEISPHKVMRNGTSLFGNVIKSLMGAGKPLLSCIKKLLSLWGKIQNEIKLHGIAILDVS
ncbi:hypothetical protein ACH42_14590 [Endozoicomonas sp. (ex Bugula neritina AB1)]|nr:hypothetical protein ACH42_14590 [Endozoicomonas sp. (ex Bugula neritina AB1)]